MININGNLYKNIDSNNINDFNFIINNFNFYEEIHFENELLFFWEDHFFRIMASLRRLRYKIPVSFNKEYLKNELIKTIKANKLEKKYGNIKFYFFSKPNENKIDYLINTSNSKLYINPDLKTKIICDIYNEEFISAGQLSNLSITNQTIRRIAHIYSIENGLNTCIMINDKKNIVESTIGNLYLIKDNKIITPNLSSGCQNLAIRSSFNRWAKKNLKLEERDINIYEIQQCEEMFFLSISKGYIRVNNFRKTTYKFDLGRKIFKNFILSI